MAEVIFCKCGHIHVVSDAQIDKAIANNKDHLLFLGETFKGRKEAAYGMKVAMERFAKEFGYQKKLDYIYEMRPYIKNLRLEDT